MGAVDCNACLTVGVSTSHVEGATLLRISVEMAAFLVQFSIEQTDVSIEICSRPFVQVN